LHVEYNRDIIKNDTLELNQLLGFSNLIFYISMFGMLKNLFKSNAQQSSIYIQPETDSVDDLNGLSMEEVAVGLYPKSSGNHFGLQPQASLKPQNLNQYHVEPGSNALD